MTLIVGAVLALFSLAIVAYPFLKSRLRVVDFHESPAVTATAPPELEPVYDAISTLQLEYQLGKIPENLYQEQLMAYRLQAATLLRQRFQENAGAPEWMLEQEVLLSRAALREPQGGPRSCPNCRSLVSPELAVCPECAAKLETRV
jgi:hypothetical protein